MFNEIKISKQIKTALDQKTKILDNIDKMFDKAMNELDQVFDHDLSFKVTESVDKILSFQDPLPSFPPCNIFTAKGELDSRTFLPFETPSYYIQLAVSGYTMADVSVRVETDNGKNTLVISSKGLNANEQKKAALGAHSVEYTWHQKGIASRAFTLNFSISNNVKVDNATLIDGLLTVRLSIIPKVAEASVQTIPISTR